MFSVFSPLVIILELFIEGFPGGSVVKNPLANAGVLSMIPGLGRSPGEGGDYPLQCSCLENPLDRGAWGAAVHGVAKELDKTEPLNNKPQITCWDSDFNSTEPID